MRILTFLGIAILGLQPFAFSQEKPAPSKEAEVLPAANELAVSFTPLEIELTYVEWDAAKDANVPDLTAASSTVVEKVTALEKGGKLTVIKRIRLSACENMKSSIQIGERRAKVVAAMAFANRTGGQNSVNYENVGMMLSLTPALVDDRIVIELTFEQSLPRTGDGPVIAERESGEKIRAESTGTLMVATTVTLKDGETIVVGGASENSVHQALLIRAKRLQ